VIGRWQSDKQPFSQTASGSNPVIRTSLRVNPRPVLANVYQRPAGDKLKIKLAGIRQRWRKVERAMGIEPTGNALSSL
jgi:hypothetical protein